MTRYELIEGGVKDRITGRAIFNPESGHYRRYLAWVAEGNVPIPLRPSPHHFLDANDQWIEDVAKRQIATIAKLTSDVQAHLDAKAVERGYDNILSLCTYATSSNPTFAAEGQAGVAWRDAVWTLCYQIMDAVLADEQPEPTSEELIAALPTMVWP